MLPSARNHDRAGLVTPALSWPAAKNWPPRVRYTARSTMIGTALVTVTIADTSVADSGVVPEPSGSCSTFTQMLNRELPATR